MDSDGEEKKEEKEEPWAAPIKALETKVDQALSLLTAKPKEKEEEAPPKAKVEEVEPPKDEVTPPKKPTPEQKKEEPPPAKPKSLLSKALFG